VVTATGRLSAHADSYAPGSGTSARLQFLGEALAKAGKPNEAVDALQRSVRLNGRSPRRFVLLAQVYTEPGQLAIADNSLTHALALEASELVAAAAK